MLRIDVTALRRGVFSEDSRLIMRSEPVPPTAAKLRNADRVDYAATRTHVIQELLQALVAPVPFTEPLPSDTLATGHHSPVGGTSGGSTITSARPLPFGSGGVHRRPLDNDDDDDDTMQNNMAALVSAASASASVFSDAAVAGPSSGTASSGGTSSSAAKDPKAVNNNTLSTTCAKGDSDKPMLPKSTILKALAEAVRSFQTVGLIIAEHIYQPDPNTLVTGTAQTAMAFILDQLLPNTELNPDRECSAAARMLVAAMAGECATMFNNAKGERVHCFGMIGNC